MMKWIKRFMLAAMAFAMLIAVAVYIAPLDVYVPQLERLLGDKVHDKVSIRKLKAGLFPLPHLQLEGVKAGAAEGVSVGSIRVVPDIRFLFEEQYVIHRITLRDGSATLAQLEGLSALLQHEPAGFPRNLQLDGVFHMNDGELGKVDLVQAARNRSGKGAKGGMTRFTELSSLLTVDGSRYHFIKLKVSSGAVNTEGRLYEPVLRPASPVLAGATAGTALLGLGLGTALGIKAGNLMKKLFSKDEKKTDGKVEPTPAK